MGIIELVLAVVYAGGAWKFWSGFHRTDFSQNRLSLSLLWPFLLMTNKSYRRNFNKTLKG